MYKNIFSVGLFSTNYNGRPILEYLFDARQLHMFVERHEPAETSGISVYHDSHRNYLVRIPGGYASGTLIKLAGRPDDFRRFFTLLDQSKAMHGLSRKTHFFGTNRHIEPAEIYVLYDMTEYKDDEPLIWGKKELTEEEAAIAIELLTGKRPEKRKPIPVQ